MFVGLQYDSIKQNHTKNKTNAKKRKKAKLQCSALQCIAMHTSETPQLFTPDESNMTQDVSNFSRWPYHFEVIFKVVVSNNGKN